MHAYYVPRIMFWVNRTKLKSDSFETAETIRWLRCQQPSRVFRVEKTLNSRPLRWISCGVALYFVHTKGINETGNGNEKTLRVNPARFFLSSSLARSAHSPCRLVWFLFVLFLLLVTEYRMCYGV